MALQSSKAVGLLLLILALGVGGRVVRGIASQPTGQGGADTALDAQLAKVNAERSRGTTRGAKAGRPPSPRKRRVSTDVNLQGRKNPPALSLGAMRSEQTPIGALDPATIRPSVASPDRPISQATRGTRPPDAASPMIDLDFAPADQIETLPRIGPVLAKRIVEDRAAHGPFGSLQGLERVRGVGPAMARLLQERVTFGWSGRPTHAEYPPR